MIELRSVTAGVFRDASFAIAPDESCRLLLASESDLTVFLQLLVGTTAPSAGEVILFGNALAGHDEAGVLALLSRVGLVWPGGGFVSNLKTWENLLLPLWYHGDAGAARREQEVVDLLERLGMAPERVPFFLGALPGTLPAPERKLLGLARALLQDAEVMVYAGLFEGLDERTRGLLREETGRHHERRPGRSSLYVAAGEHGLPEPFEGRSLVQTPDGGIAAWR